MHLFKIMDKKNREKAFVIGYNNLIALLPYNLKFEHDIVLEVEELENMATGVYSNDIVESVLRVNEGKTEICPTLRLAATIAAAINEDESVLNCYAINIYGQNEESIKIPAYAVARWWREERGPECFAKMISSLRQKDFESAMEEFLEPAIECLPDHLMTQLAQCAYFSTSGSRDYFNNWLNYIEKENIQSLTSATYESNRLR